MTPPETAFTMANMYGLIFDMDGVLIDSAEPHWQSWRRLAGELGCELSEEGFTQTFGRQNRDIIPFFFGHDDEPTIRRLGDRKEELYREIIRDRIPAMDGAVDLVRACHDAGFALAIGSSGPPENINLVLQGLQIEPLFRAVITSKQVTCGKPDPQVFNLAAAGLGISTDRCAVIEDAPAGVEAALSAGAAAIALTGTHPPEALVAAHRVVSSLRELSPASIRNLIQSFDVA